MLGPKSYSMLANLKPYVGGKGSCPLQTAEAEKWGGVGQLSVPPGNVGMAHELQFVRPRTVFISTPLRKTKYAIQKTTSGTPAQSKMEPQMQIGL